MSSCLPWIPEAHADPEFTGRVISVQNEPNAIQNAIDSLETNDGDVLELDGSLGVYQVYNRINVYKRIKLTSKAGAPQAVMSGSNIFGLILISIDGVLIQNLKIANASNAFVGGCVVFGSTFSGTSVLKECEIITLISGVVLNSQFRGQAKIEDCDFKFSTTLSFQFGVVIFCQEKASCFVEGCRLYPSISSDVPGVPRSYIATFQGNLKEPFLFVTRGCTNALKDTVTARGFILIETVSTETQPLAQFYIDQTQFENVQQSVFQYFSPSQVIALDFVSVTDSYFKFGRPSGSTESSVSLISFNGTAGANVFPSVPPRVFLNNAQYDDDGIPTGPNLLPLAEYEDSSPVPVQLVSYDLTVFSPPSTLITVREPPACRSVGVKRGQSRSKMQLYSNEAETRIVEFFPQTWFHGMA